MKTTPNFPLGQRVAVSFRGYNVTNVGKTKDLLTHPLLAEPLRRYLTCADQLYHEVTGVRCDLAELIARDEPSTLETYTRDLAMIVAIEMAHWEALLAVIGPEGKKRIRLLNGYSLGEVTAMIVSGLLSFEAALRPVLELSADAASLARNVTMGVLFSRGTVLDCELIRQKCEEITSQGTGVIAISTYLSPNTVLLMGEGETIDRFKQEMENFLPQSVHLRKNPHRWPPLHTPIVLQKFLRDRAAVILQTTTTADTLPEYPILSCVSGDIGYNGKNTRYMMTEWVDQPQKLWDCVHAMLQMGIDQVIHLGPEPNILPATLSRLSDNVQAQCNQANWYGYGLRTFSRLAADRQWLTRLVSRDAVLLRAPFVQQVFWEDWLCELATEQTTATT